MAKTGRPPKYNKNEIEEIKSKLESYIKKTNIPIIAEFAYKNDIPRVSLYDYKEFSTLLKKLIDKKETNLERDGLDKSKFTPMHAFSLKQLGWRDKQEKETEQDDNDLSFEGWG